MYCLQYRIQKQSKYIEQSVCSIAACICISSTILEKYKEKTQRNLHFCIILTYRQICSIDKQIGMYFVYIVQYVQFRYFALLEKKNLKIVPTFNRQKTYRNFGYNVGIFYLPQILFSSCPTLLVQPVYKKLKLGKTRGRYRYKVYLFWTSGTASSYKINLVVLKIQKWTYTSEPKYPRFQNFVNTNQPTGEHFNLPGHELYHLKVSVLKKVWDLGRSLLEVRESKFTLEIL